MELTVKRFITGPIETNTYVLSQENGVCIIIDPSGGCERVLDYIKDKELSPEAVCLTHCHFDHVGGLEELKTITDAPIFVHPDAVECFIHRWYVQL